MGIHRCRFLFYKTALADKKIPTCRPSRRKIPTNGNTGRPGTELLAELWRIRMRHGTERVKTRL